MKKALVRSLGVGRFLDWKALNAEGTMGGILLLLNRRRIRLVDWPGSITNHGYKSYLWPGSITNRGYKSYLWSGSTTNRRGFVLAATIGGSIAGVLF